MPRRAAKPNQVVDTPQHRISDVFIEVSCSECGQDLGKYVGHASMVQAKLFERLRNHNPVCSKIRALCGEDAR